MKIRYFSKEAILANPKLCEFWKDPAQTLDDATALDRAIMLLPEAVTRFVRPTMSMEVEAEFKGGECVKGDRDAVRREVMRDAALKNARLVFVVDRKHGVRLKEFIYLFLADSKSKFVELPEEVVGFWEHHVKDMKRRLPF